MILIYLGADDGGRREEGTEMEQMTKLGEEEREHMTEL